MRFCHIFCHYLPTCGKTAPLYPSTKCIHVKIFSALVTENSFTFTKKILPIISIYCIKHLQYLLYQLVFTASSTCTKFYARYCMSCSKIDVMVARYRVRINKQTTELILTRSQKNCSPKTTNACTNHVYVFIHLSQSVKSKLSLTFTKKEI